MIQPEGESKASGFISVLGRSEGRTAGPTDVGDPQPGDTWGVQWKQKTGVVSGAGET